MVERVLATSEQLKGVITQAIIVDARGQAEVLQKGDGLEEWAKANSLKWTNIHYNQDLPTEEAFFTKALACLPEDKNIPIIVHCNSGGRASRAKNALEGMGYTTVLNGTSATNIRTSCS